MKVVATLAVGLLLAPVPAAAEDAPGPAWPGRTIRYHETLPRSWNWSLQRAVQTWNDSGVRIEFQRVPRGRAQVVIGYGDTGGNAGQATIGRRTGAFVHMEPRLFKPLRPRARVFAAIVLAHELGHVLGLDHAGARGCRLMAARPLTFCPDPPQTWLARCRWLAARDVRAALRLYGGRDERRPTPWCLREPRPPALPVTFQPGQASWPQVPVLLGTRVRITPCGAQTGRLIRIGVGRYRSTGCVEIALVNKYGLAGPTVTGDLT